MGWATKIRQFTEFKPSILADSETFDVDEFLAMFSSYDNHAREIMVVYVVPRKSWAIVLRDSTKPPAYWTSKGYSHEEWRKYCINDILSEEEIVAKVQEVKQTWYEKSDPRYYGFTPGVAHTHHDKNSNKFRYSDFHFHGLQGEMHPNFTAEGNEFCPIHSLIDNEINNM